MRQRHIHNKSQFWAPAQDSLGGTLALQKLVCGIMKHGKKQRAFSLVYNAMHLALGRVSGLPQGQIPPSIPPRVRTSPSFLGDDLQFLMQAIENVRPSLELRSKKIAGISREIPCLVPQHRGQGIAIRWLLDAARARKKTGSRGLTENLAEELVDAYLQRGSPRQRRDTLHKTASTNRAYLRYRWW
jgi:small subunit ribosomal protein S7